MPILLMEENVVAGCAAILSVKQESPAFELVACYKKPIAKSIFKRLIEIAEEAEANYCAANADRSVWR